MHLYVRAGEIYTEIPNITLKYGCIPTIGDLNDDDDDNGMRRMRETLNMEPAMWFKVLLLDSLSIDCMKRTVMWNCDSALSPMLEKSFAEDLDKRQRRKRISESMYIGGEFYGFDSDLDELFTSVERIVYEYGKGEILQHGFYDKLLKLLHCHVLPAIAVTIEDIPRVEKVLVDIEDAIKTAEEDIVVADKKINEILKSMRKLRQKFVQEYSQNSEKLTGPCNIDFARTLQHDVEEELQKSGEELERLQDAVETAKKKLQEKEEGVTEEVIEEKRRARDLCFEKHKDLLTTREILHDITKRAEDRKTSLGASIKKSLRNNLDKKNHVLNPLHSIYVELHNTFETAQEEYQKQCERKLLIISVKEAVRTTMADLKSGESSVGLDIDKLGRKRATDVLEGSAVSKEWQTIAEKVANTLSEKANKITIKHESFCQKVINRCKSVLFDKKLMEIVDPKNKAVSRIQAQSRETASSLPAKLIEKEKTEDRKFISDSGYLSHIETDCQSERASLPVQPRGVSEVSEAYSDTFMVNNCVLPARENIRDSVVQFERVLDNEDVVIVQDSEKNLLKTATESLRDDILVHMRDITEMFQDEFNQHTPTAFKNIWLRYEAHFYEVTMTHVVKLYELSYLQFAEWFSESVSSLTASDLDLNGTVISGMLQEATPAMLSPESMDEVFSSQGSQQSRSPSLIESICEQLQLSDDPEVSDAFKYPVQESDDSGHDLSEQDTVMRRHKSEPGPNDGKGASTLQQNLKRITIQYPDSFTVLYNRRTWCVNDIDFAVEASESMTSSSTQENFGNFNMCMSAKLTTLLPEYQTVFQPTMHCIHEAILTNTPLIKLQHLTKCLREINQRVSDFQTAHFHKSTGACADDLVDMLVIILCNCDTNDTMQLYSHLKLLADLIPPFFEGGPYSFSLVQFSVAYQFVQERMVRRKETAN